MGQICVNIWRKGFSINLFFYGRIVAGLSWYGFVLLFGIVAFGIVWLSVSCRLHVHYT